MTIILLIIMLIPLLGTAIGSSFVYFLDNKNMKTMTFIKCCSIGVMIGVALISLFEPALNSAVFMSNWAYIHFAEIVLAIALIMQISDYVLRKFVDINKYSKSISLIAALVIHNIPERIIVGAVASSSIFLDQQLMPAMLMSLAVAAQNLPEGAMVSFSLLNDNMKHKKAFFVGVLSGIIEPIFAITFYFIGYINSYKMPYLLIIAASFMLYVAFEFIQDAFNKNKRRVVDIFALILGVVLILCLEHI